MPLCTHCLNGAESNGTVEDPTLTDGETCNRCGQGAPEERRKIAAGIHTHGDGGEDHQDKQLRAFRVIRDPDNTRIDTDGEVLGWGVEFPSGACHVDWYRGAFPAEDRLDHPHISQYGSMEDVEQGTGGIVEIMATLEVGS